MLEWRQRSISIPKCQQLTRLIMHRTRQNALTTTWLLFFTPHLSYLCVCVCVHRWDGITSALWTRRCFVTAQRTLQEELPEKRIPPSWVWLEMLHINNHHCPVNFHVGRSEVVLGAVGNVSHINRVWHNGDAEEQEVFCFLKWTLWNSARSVEDVTALMVFPFQVLLSTSVRTHLANLTIT